MKKNLKLWLVNPPLGNFIEEPYPPLGLAYIAAAVEQSGYDVGILDMPVLQLDFEEARRDLESMHPDVVGITCVAANYVKAMKLAELAKKTCGSTVVIGGPHVTFISTDLLRENPHVDAVVRGEGEQAMLEIMQVTAKGESFKNIDGVTYRDESGRIRVNRDRQLITNLDELPRPARHLLPMDKYKQLTEYTSVLASRGCPYECLFCSASSFWSHKVRFKNPQRIIDEIADTVRTYGFDHFKFVDDVFFLKGRRAEELLRMLRKSRVKWACNVRIDLVNEKTVELAAEAGCVKMIFGIESLSDKVLQAIDKNMNITKTGDIVKLAEKKGITTKLNFIIGLPEQTEEDVLTCLRFLEQTKPSEVMFAPLTPYPGTEIVALADKKGITFRDINWWKRDSNQRQVKTARLSCDKVDLLLSVARSFVTGKGILNLQGY